MHTIVQDSEGVDPVKAMTLKVQTMPYVTPSIVKSPDEVFSAMGDSIEPYQISPEQERAFYEASSASQGQLATQKHSKKYLLETHLKNLELLRDSKATTKHLILSTAYSPSVCSLYTLQKISLSELKLETHHRGCFVTAKTITFPHQFAEVVTIIEDENGNVARLVIGFQDDSLSISGPILPINSTVAIKEPYCKFIGEGNYVIRVDHPSDIAVLRGDDPALVLIMQFVAEGKEVTPLQWKSAGDKAYLEKRYSSAIECYTQAIDNSSLEDRAFSLDVYRKRAFANLTAKVFTSAKDDALASGLGDAIDEKASYCAGRAAYELSEYAKSKEYIENALKLNPKNLKYKKELKRANSRIKEVEGGIYDFHSMVTSVTKQNIHLDYADWTKNTAIKSTPTHGRGLFATRDIEAGELVLCEKAFCLPNRYEGEEGSDLVMYNLNTTSRTQRPAQTALFLHLVQKLYNNPHLNKSFFDLDGGNYLRSGKEGELVDGVPIIDTFLVEAIRLTNCFSCPRLSLELLKARLAESDTELSTGLWRRAACLNHSCIPNCSRAFIGEMMIIRSTCFVPAGTELLHQYSSPDEDFTLRRGFFQSQWNFECDCHLCTAEAKSPETMHQKRRELVEKIKIEVLKSPVNSRIPGATIKHIERLTKKLEDLHEAPIYSSLPRLLLVHPTIWLTEQYRSLRNPSKTLKYAFEVLRNFGFVNAVRDGELELDYDKGIVNSESFNMLRYAVEAYHAVGKVELSVRCEEEARRMFKILTGCDIGIEEVFAGLR